MLTSLLTDEKVITIIYQIRGYKVMFDRDLADLYNVETRSLNQAVKRNANRFPTDFMFQLTPKELDNWISQIVISNYDFRMGLRKMPYVFTEQGVAMLSSVLKSDTAVEVNIQIIRIFSRIREIGSQHADVLLKLEQIENKILNQQLQVSSHDDEIATIFKHLKQLLNSPNPERDAIGY